MAARELGIAISKESKHFAAHCLDVDVSCFGDSQDQALRGVNEALDLYFEGAGPDIQAPKIVRDAHGSSDTADWSKADWKSNH